jgi:hypothetical protein
MKTHFASPERSTIEEIRAEGKSLKYLSEQSLFTDSIPNIILVLNRNRQIVYGNHALLNYLHLEELDSALGLRPGELIGCAHALESESGCGTTKNCCTCGAVKAILTSLNGKEASEECRVLTKDNDALDFRVNCVPIDIQGERYVVFSLSDISDTKRRNALERIFFHDVLNTVGGIQGFTELLSISSPEEITGFGAIIANLTTQLMDEINAQKDLLAAESGEYRVTYHLIFTSLLIKESIRLYEKHSVAFEKQIVEGANSTDIDFVSDVRLVRRILGNMVKNALEATDPSGVVTIAAEKRLGFTVLLVHNVKYIQPLYQLQMFKRSFSTKDSARGLGTYSIKLLTEKYLKGRAGFISDIDKGTTFYAILPSYGPLS